MPLLLRLALLLLPLTAFAAVPEYVDVEQQLSAQERQETGLDTLSPAQLKRLNELLREKAQARTAAAPVQAAPAADADDLSAAPATASAPRAIPMDLEIRTIKSRLRGRVESWAPGTEFRLENGQTWKVLKGEITLRQPLESPEILVVPGLAGRWFLQVHEDYPKARVYRID